MMHLVSTDQLKKVIIDVISVQGYIINVFILFIINNKIVLARFKLLFFFFNVIAGLN